MSRPTTANTPPSISHHQTLMKFDISMHAYLCLNDVGTARDLKHSSIKLVRRDWSAQARLSTSVSWGEVPASVTLLKNSRFFAIGTAAVPPLS